MDSSQQNKIDKEWKRFVRKARNSIEDLGDNLTEDERTRLVRSLVRDYNPLTEQHAEKFILEYSNLIENGYDESTPPEKQDT